MQEDSLLLLEEGIKESYEKPCDRELYLKNESTASLQTNTGDEE
jgi:hypothetical protein